MHKAGDCNRSFLSFFSSLVSLSRIASLNFVAAIAVGIAWFAVQIAVGLAETDPTILRTNRVPLGAAVLIIVQLILLVLYLRSSELTGLVRVFAAAMGLLQLLQVLVGAIAAVADGFAFPTATHGVMAYLALSNLAFAALGKPRTKALPDA